MEHPVLVRKYGGSSLAHPWQIKSIAQELCRLRNEGFRVIAVVSAMGKTTDELVRLSREISSRPHPREVDMLLSAGERISMALLSLALQDQGCPAISFTGSQAGIFTDESHTQARIQDLRPIRIKEELEKGKTVVLAGFQGVCPRTKEITTLGRGGSDTTAVAMAAHFQAQICEILKDVPGVLSADPKIVTQAKLLEHISYEQLLHMTFWGAKVMHYRSVELAYALGIPLRIATAHPRKSDSSEKLQTPEKSTLIDRGPNMYEISKVFSVNVLHHVACMAVQASDLESAYECIQDALGKNGRPWPQILETEQASKNDYKIYFTAPEENIGDLKAVIQGHPQITWQETGWSAIALTCQGMVGTDLSFRLLQNFKAQKLKAHKLIYAPVGLTLFVDKSQVNAAVSACHALV